MPRASKFITFEGLFQSNVLGIFSIIRGFANLKDLAAVSCPFEMTEAPVQGQVFGHQRQIDERHADEIKSFLEKGDNRFLPEVILSIRTECEPEMIGAGQVGIRSKGADGIFIKRRFVSRNLRVQTISIDKDRLAEILKTRLIRRIDGNHRLARASDLADDQTLPTKYLAPFCFVLLGPPGQEEDDYAESLMFHTLNSKALPLDSEHALRLILGQKPDYIMRPDVEFGYSPSLHLTRLLHDRVQKLHKPARDRLGNRPLTCISMAADSMIAADRGIVADRAALTHFADDLISALNDIVTRLSPEHQDFCQQPFFLDLAARIWKQSAGINHEDRVQATVAKLKGVGLWLRANDLMDMIGRNAPCEQLLKIYDRIQLSIPKRVFLARWYPDTEDGDATQKAVLRLDQIKRTLVDLKRDKKILLSLIDMGTALGGTYPIHPKMYEAIRSSDIILIDLTGLRPNVCVEAGFALQHHEKDRLLFLFQPSPDALKVPFDLSTFRYEQITDAAEIPGKIAPHLEKIIGNWGQAPISPPPASASPLPAPAGKPDGRD